MSNAGQQTYATTFTAEEDDWWTPRWLAQAARNVLGHIDLDPASCPGANYFIDARQIYTREDNGLSLPWQGRVYLNPPSKRGDPFARVNLWAEKLDTEFYMGNVEMAILVVKSNLGYNWYERLYRRYPVCHLEKLPIFFNPSRETQGTAKKGVSVFYFGHALDDFRLVFRAYGRVIPPKSVLEKGMKW